MRIFIIFLCIFLSSGNFYCQLIRSNFIYENVIKGVYDHYNRTCIVMLHATQEPIEGQGLRESGNLQNLQGFFSRAYIRTAIILTSTFQEQIDTGYLSNMARPLFVLLNDDDDVRRLALRIGPFIPPDHTWLIFLREETSIERFFGYNYLRFDSSIMVTKPDGNLSSPGEIITEVYRINEGDILRSNLLGTWNQEMGIKLSQLSLYQRRNDFQGHTLHVTSLEDPPLSIIIRDHNGSMIGLGGFFGGLMGLLRESMNFTILYRETTEMGIRYQNGSCCGAVGQLIFNDTDIVAAATFMTPLIMDYIRFSTPVSSTKSWVYIKRPATSRSNWGAYFIPFEPNVWMAIVAMIVITTITMFLLNSAISLFASDWKDNGDIPTSVPDIFFSVFGVFCNQGMVASILDPIRIIHFVIHLTGVIILTAYSADMISALTVPIFVMPFTTIGGLLEDGTYRFGVVRNSPSYVSFRSSTHVVFRAIFNKLLLKEKNLPNNDLDGLQLVCKEDKYAFMSRDIIVSLLQSQIGCTLVPLDELSLTTISLALRPDSPYQGIINSRLLMLRDSGIMQRLLHPNSTVFEDNVDKGLLSVEIKNILPLLVLLVAGVFMSLIILSIEKFLKRNEKIIKKEKKIVEKFLKNIKLPSTRKNHVQPFYN